MSIQVRARTTALDILSVNLSDVIALPDEKAAPALNERMAVLDQVHRIHERSFAERGIIAREFERRKLWQYLVDPHTNEVFSSFSAWMACPDYIGCRRVNFEAKRDIESMPEIPAEQLREIPKSNIKVLRQLSSHVRAEPEVLEAAKSLPQNEFLKKIEADHADQHLEVRRLLRFSPGRSGSKIVEEAIRWALDHDIAGTRDEALVRMAETALKDWELDAELEQMTEEEKAEA